MYTIVLLYYIKLNLNNIHIFFSRCIPDCDNCRYGTCVGANVCQCYSGYEKHSNGTCIPRCDEGCRNGDCTGRNACTCHEGYTIGSNDHECVPHCENSCTNGYCSEPNTCKCLKGIFEQIIVRPRS